MKTTIIILFIAAFLQATIVPVKLVLIILICRAYLKPERSNLFLAFAFGLMTAYLTLDDLGLQSLIFLMLIQLAQIFSKVRIFSHPLLIVPLTFGLLSINGFVYSLINQQSFQIPPSFFTESILSLLIIYLVKFWEERFIVQKEVKLKFR